MTANVAPTPSGRVINPARAVPILLFLFVFALVIDNGFKFLSPPMAEDFGLSVSTVSLQATLAGIVVGVGAVVYSAMADSIPIRRLILVSLIVTALGSVIGFAFQGSFPLVLTGRIVQTAGIAAAETLYVVYVTKHFRGERQKMFLGFSTAAYQLSVLIGAVGSGFIATYIGWTAFFLVALIPLVTIPIVLWTVPPEETVGGHVDLFGLFLIALVAIGAVLYMQDFTPWYLILIAVSLAGFVWHVRSHENALISGAFFANGQYTLMLVVVFVLYSVYLGYQFLFPFLIQDLYGWNLSSISLLLVPGYIVAVIVGAATGLIAKFLTSKQAITVAMIMIILALLGPALFVDRWVGLFVISMMLFGSGFALMYAPLLSTAIMRVAPQHSGVAIGFYNLTINIAVPIGIAYTAKLMDLDIGFLGGLVGSEAASGYGSVLIILTVIAVVSLVLYWIFVGMLQKRGVPMNTPDEAEQSVA